MNEMVSILVLVGGGLYFFQSREKLHDLGLALMGLGFIFMGLYWMKEGTEPVRGMPAVVQSSAATTAIAMTLAQQGLLSFEAAAAILKVTRRLRKGGQKFSEPSLRVLLDVHDRTAAFAEMVSGLLKSPIPGFDLAAVQTQSKGLHELVRSSRQGQLGRIGPNDPTSPIRTFQHRIVVVLRAEGVDNEVRANLVAREHIDFWCKTHVNDGSDWCLTLLARDCLTLLAPKV